jgi:presenilin-like A22 family membrane protease
MKRFLLKTAFVVAVLFLTLVFVVPAQLLLELILPSVEWREGHYHGGDRLLPGLLVVFACLYSANRIVSFLFRRTGLSDKRWSLLARRTFG